MTRHGLAFNAAPELSAFDHIVACGDDVPNATSLEKELKELVDLREVADRLTSNVIKRLWRGQANDRGLMELIEEVGDIHSVMQKLGILHKR